MFRSPKKIAWLEQHGYNVAVLEATAPREGDALLIDPQHKDWLAELARVKSAKTALKPKAWTPDQPARGVGDIIAKVTNAVGIKPCAPCKKRQAMLNKLWSFKR